MEYFNKLKAMLSGGQKDPYKEAGKTLGDAYNRSMAGSTAVGREELAAQDKSSRLKAIAKEQARQRWISDGNDPADFDRQWDEGGIMGANKQY